MEWAAGKMMAFGCVTLIPGQRKDKPTGLSDNSEGCQQCESKLVLGNREGTALLLSSPSIVAFFDVAALT